ncbi:carbohydrate-binding domain-containing protein [Isoptericola haloaureus]|uniref:Carbohydrate-binding domain-containing protein n=1 Tax=Isoptericola haloaureus TaxID=1542902 RepID=A0ABU7Z5T4_9MICO
MNPTTLPRRTRSTWSKALGGAAAAALAVGALGACGTTSEESAAATTSESSTTTEDSTSSDDATVLTASSAGLTAAEVLAENLDASETVALADGSWVSTDEVAIDLSSPSAADGVEVDGDTVTITRPGTYRLSGVLAGQVVVESEDDGVVRLVLDGADVLSSTGAAIDVQDTDQVSVVLADGSTNRLEDSADYEETEADNAANAALYSTADLAISGAGSLEVVGNSNDGITGKDGLAITAGDITVDAVDDAIRGKDYLVVTGGTIDVTAGGDGLKSDEDSDATAGYVALLDGEVTVAAGSDGVQGFTDVAVAGGTLSVTESEEGVEAAVITISGGTVDVASSDDGLNATVKEADEDTEDAASTEESTEMAGPGGGGGGEAVQEGASLTVTGGSVTVAADGDGLDSNGVIDVTGGEIVIAAAANGGEGPVDANGTVTSANGWLTLDGSADAGSTITVLDADGQEVASVVAGQSLSSLHLTADGIVAGQSYTVQVDGTDVGTATAVESIATTMGPGGGGAPGDREMPGDGGRPGGGQPPAEGSMPGGA